MGSLTTCKEFLESLQNLFKKIKPEEKHESCLENWNCLGITAVFCFFFNVGHVNTSARRRRILRPGRRV